MEEPVGRQQKLFSPSNPKIAYKESDLGEMLKNQNRSKVARTTTAEVATTIATH
jgi:hypothetical protein